MKRRLPARLSLPRCHPLVPLVLTALLSSPLHAEPAPPPAAANHAATGADTPSLTPLTVSARRREELAQEVPAPVSVVDGTTLEARRIDRIEDIQQLLPSTSVAFINPRQTSIAVRGLGNNPANDGLEGSTGLYLDNVYLSRPGMAVFDLLDIEQIELMRGPRARCSARTPRPAY
ncbi:TonB-dependent receptor plug domain-containing protein [Microvirgula aerodenitrificans]|uniref:TonB-dependent receptor plug domain-containing protein n=1 Tax=Microvirgula aerodenitrificans TaxID=57480 RepID=UPI0019015580|nr:TonB-dependent receptor plug domain-containing protein [Microvirgula aerodenitrificans]